MDRDRNLLFGVFAVQLRKVTPSQIMEAAAAWAVDPAKDLADRLLAARAIQPRDKALIQRLVDEAIAEYGGDVHATLVAFGGDDQIAESFCGTISLTGSGGVQVTKPAPGAPVLLSDRAPGVQETPGRYTRESEHARGGMGRVLLVHDEHLGRDIALKELLPIPGQSDLTPQTPARLSAGLIARFLQEARITGQLEHPAIVPVYELGTRNDGSLYYTMKLVRGGSMAESIRKAATLEDRLKLLPHFVDLCQAIAYAHSRGVIHRDLKPGNVMVGEFGETVVIDWGLAKAKGKKDIHEEELSRTFEMISKGHAADAVNTAYGYALGTPAYMPPEQAKGQLDQIDERSDVYSLGAILYELLTGRLPFKGDSLADTLKKVITEEPRPIREFTPDAPPELAAIAMRALRKDPKDRYESAKDLAQEVQRFQSGALVRAYKYTLTDRAARFIRRHRTLVGTVAAAALLLVAFGAYSFWRINAERDQALVARDNESLARQEAERTIEQLEYSNYVSAIRLAQADIDAHNPTMARSRLMDCPVRYRNWEWGYLFDRLDSSLVSLYGHSGIVTAASFSPDRTRIVTASYDRSAKVWDAKTGQQLTTLFGHSDRIASVSFDRDGRRVVTASWDKSAKIWDLDTGQALTTLSGHSGAVVDASFRPDGGCVVTCSWDKSAKVWDAVTGQHLFTLTGHSRSVTSASFRIDGAQIVTASDDGTVKVWDAATGQELVTLSGNSRPVNSAMFSPNGTRIVAALLDGAAKVWDTETGRELTTLYGHTGRVLSASFSPDSTRIVTGSDDRTAMVWDVATGRNLFALSGHSRGVVNASFSPEGTQILTASDDASAKVWDAQINFQFDTNSDRSERLVEASFSPDGKRILTASQDNWVKVWDAQTDEVLVTLVGKTGTLVDASFSPDGTRIVTPTVDNAAKIWNALTGQNLMTLSGHSGRISDASFSSDGTRIVTASVDKSAKVWNAETGQEIMTMYGHDGAVTSASFSPDGNRIVTTSWDKSTKIWDVQTGDVLFALPNLAFPYMDASFSPNGRFIVTVSREHDARVWDAVTGDKVHTLSGHADWVFDASFSPDGRRIVTTSQDKSAKIWDSATGRELLTISNYSNSMYGASFSPDGMQIVTATGEARPNIWNSAPWHPDAWQDDDIRPRFIKFALRDAPKVSNILYDPLSDQTLDILENIEFAASQLRELDIPGLRGDIRLVAGQGIYVANAASLPSIPGIVLEAHDLITSIDARSIHSIREAAAILTEYAVARRTNASVGKRIIVEVVNAYDREWFVLDFPGLVENRLNIGRELLPDFPMLAANELQQNIKQAEDADSVDSSRILYVARLAQPLDLEATDELISLNGEAIGGFPSLLAAFNNLRERTEKGTLTSTDLIVHRPRTNQRIRTKIIIDPDSPAP